MLLLPVTQSLRAGDIWDGYIKVGNVWLNVGGANNGQYASYGNTVDNGAHDSSNRNSASSYSFGTQTYNSFAINAFTIFGWTANGETASNSGANYRVWKSSDAEPGSYSNYYGNVGPNYAFNNADFASTAAQDTQIIGDTFINGATYNLRFEVYTHINGTKKFYSNANAATFTVAGAREEVTITSGSTTQTAAYNTSANGGVVKKGAGTIVLTKDSSSSTTGQKGHIYIDAGTVSITPDAGVTANQAIGGSSAVVYVGPDATSGTAEFRLGATGGGLTVNRSVVVRTGGGTRTLSSANTSGTSTFAGSVTLDGAATIDAASGGTLDFSGIISGSSGFTKTGSGVLNLSGNNTYSGATQITLGTVTVSSGGKLGNGNSDVTISSGATLNVNTSLTIDSIKETGSGNGGVVAIGTGATLTVDGANKGNLFQNSISGAGNLTMAGSGTTSLSLYGTQSYTGTTTVLGGKISTGVALSSAAFSLTGGTFETSAADVISDTATVTLGGGTFSVGGTETFGNNGVSLTASTTSAVSPTNGVTATIGGALTGSGNLTKGDTGILVLSAAHSTYSGTTTLNAGTLRLGNDTAIGTGGLTINGGTLSSSTSANRSLGNNITMGGNVNLGEASAGTGNLTLNGTVALGASGRTFTVNNTTTTIAGVISGNSVGITKAGTGTLSLLGDNTFSGNVIISAGTLSITNANSLGRGDFNFGNGNTLTTLLVNSNTTITNKFRVYNAASNAVINVVANTTNTISGQLTQDGSDAKTKFGKDGEGTLILNNSTSDFKGQLQVGMGTVILGHSSALGSNSSLTDRGVDLGLNVGDTVTSADATLLASNGVTVGQSIYVAPTNSNSQRIIGLSGSGTATFNNEVRMEAGASLTVRAGTSSTDQVTISGAITGQNGTTQNLIKNEAGTLVLSGSSANTYGGNTTINSGTLRLAKTAGVNAIASGTIAVNSGGTLLLGAANQIGDNTGITMSGGELRTGGNADAVGKLTVTANSTIVGLNTSGTSSANSFMFSDIDLGAYTTANLGTASGLTLYSSGSSGSYVKYQLGDTINLSSKNNWADATSLNNFASKISFDNTAIMAQINFTSGSGITTLSVVAVPEPRVYMAAGALAMLIGFSEYRRRKKIVSSKA